MDKTDRKKFEIAEDECPVLAFLKRLRKKMQEANKPAQSSGNDAAADLLVNWGSGFAKALAIMTNCVTNAINALDGVLCPSLPSTLPSESPFNTIKTDLGFSVIWQNM